MRVVGRYSLELTFDSGEVGIWDFEPLMWGPVFAPLLADYALFCSITANSETGTIVWPIGAAYDPSDLYRRSKFINPTMTSPWRSRPQTERRPRETLPMNVGTQVINGIAADCGDNLGAVDTAEAGEPNTPEPANHGEASREAWLWSRPEKPYIDLPVTPELESLPLERLAYRDAERLFLCLLERQCNVTYAKSYGLPGQEQEGIDVYARLRDTPRPSVPDTEPEASDNESEPGGVAVDGNAPPTLPLRTPRRHVVLQSKRASEVYPSTLKDAVTKFLDGPWPVAAQTFIFATTFDFRERNLDQAVRDATDRLERVGVFAPEWIVPLAEVLRDLGCAARLDREQTDQDQYRDGQDGELQHTSNVYLRRHDLQLRRGKLEAFDCRQQTRQTQEER